MGAFDCCICGTPVYEAKESRSTNPELSHRSCVEEREHRARIEAETVARIVAFIEAKAAKGCGYRHATYVDACAHCEYERSLESVAENIRDGDWRKAGG